MTGVALVTVARPKMELHRTKRPNGFVAVLHDHVLRGGHDEGDLAFLQFNGGIASRESLPSICKRRGGKDAGKHSKEGECSFHIPSPKPLGKPKGKQHSAC